MARRKFKQFRIAMVLFTCSVWTCSSPTKADSSALDNSTELLKSCDFEAMPPAMKDIQVVSWRDGSRICESAANSLGQPVPVGVFRALLKASAVLKFKGAGDIDKNAYQLAELIQARGLTDPARMIATVDIAIKAYNGSNGRVTPKDLNVAVRNLKTGKAMSDDDLFTIAAMISVRKRNNGE